MSPLPLRSARNELLIVFAPQVTGPTESTRHHIDQKVLSSHATFLVTYKCGYAKRPRTACRSKGRSNALALFRDKEPTRRAKLRISLSNVGKGKLSHLLKNNSEQQVNRSFMFGRIWTKGVPWASKQLVRGSHVFARIEKSLYG